MLVLKPGIAGAALATTISRIASGLIALSCLPKFRTVSLKREIFSVYVAPDMFNSGEAA
jgi:Na+-driven multidrug efflux pump